MSVQAWVDDRVPAQCRHFDAAAAGRVSRVVLAAEVAHLEAEAAVGAYVAERSADPALAQGCAALGALVGLAGDDVFFTEGASTAFTTLLDAWPLPPGARIGVVDSEFGSNALALRRRAPLRGWELVELPADALGRVTEVPAGLSLLCLPHVPSQRGIVQPTEDLIASGVPVLLDGAQAFGQVSVPVGAAAYVGTSRKWLCGPRGVGFGIVDPGWQAQLTAPPTLNGIEHAGMRRFDGADPHVAGRVGLSLAARSWSPALLPVVLAAAAAARVLLDGAGGWRVVEPLEEPTGITTLRHASADPEVTREALLAEGLLLSAVPVTRSDDLPGPVLRVSAPAWVTPADLEALAAALERGSR